MRRWRPQRRKLAEANSNAHRQAEYQRPFNRADVGRKVERVTRVEAKAAAQNDHAGNGICVSDRGYWIVPCPGKKPMRTGWQKDRVTRSELKAILTDGQLNMATVLNQSDLIDVECDTPEAEAALVEHFGGQVPATPTSAEQTGQALVVQKSAGRVGGESGHYNRGHRIPSWER